MDEKFVRKRITELRMKKNVSEYKMSLDLGHSRSYIQNISSGRVNPSMSEFLYICEYLGVTPCGFFEEKTEDPALVRRAADGLKKLNSEDLQMLVVLIERLGDDGNH